MGCFKAEKKKWIFPLFMASLLTIFLIASLLNLRLISYINTVNSILTLMQLNSFSMDSTMYNAPPRFAYLISGSKGDLEKLWRTLQSVYHPLNYYVLHLDLEAPARERSELASRLRKHPLLSEVGNVYMHERANMVTYRGPTMVANTLHACAILLKRYKDWDWFINLSASDYPLITQDGNSILSSISFLRLVF